MQYLLSSSWLEELPGKFWSAQESLNSLCVVEKVENALSLISTNDPPTAPPSYDDKKPFIVPYFTSLCWGFQTNDPTTSLPSYDIKTHLLSPLLRGGVFRQLLLQS